MKTTISLTLDTRHVYVLAACILALPLTFGVYKAFADPPAGSPVPRVINYDGTLEQNGAAVNGDFDFRFQLIDGYDEVVWPGSGEYAERTLPVAQGRFSVQFPDNTANPNEVALGDAVFETKPLKLKIAVRPAGTGAWTSFNRSLVLNSAPFAVRAETAEVLAGRSTGCPGSSCLNSNIVLIEGPSVQMEIGVIKATSAYCPQAYPIPLSCDCYNGNNNDGNLLAHTSTGWNMPSQWRDSQENKRAGCYCVWMGIGSAGVGVARMVCME